VRLQQPGRIGALNQRRRLGGDRRLIERLSVLRASGRGRSRAQGHEESNETLRSDRSFHEFPSGDDDV